MAFTATVLTLFPEMFPGTLGLSLAGKALEQGVWALKTLDIRAFTTDKHRSVDDTPAGGGPGMVLRVDVLAKAVEAAEALQPDVPVLAMTPRGASLTQQRVRDLAAGPGVTLLCGRFEGFDERLFDWAQARGRPIEQVSVGDVVLSGGEPAALLLLDACVRLLPGVMGHGTSHAEESFEGDLLEYPHYTRPTEWAGLRVPDVLLSGHHAAIAAWRKAQAEARTQAWRPDLWARYRARQSQSPSAKGRRRLPPDRSDGGE